MIQYLNRSQATSALGRGAAATYCKSSCRHGACVVSQDASALFGCKQRVARNNTGAAYGGAVSARSSGMIPISRLIEHPLLYSSTGTPVRTIRAELAYLHLSAVRPEAVGSLAEGTPSIGTVGPKIQLAILKSF